MASDLPVFEEVEVLIETGRYDEAAAGLALLQAEWSKALTAGILGNLTCGETNGTRQHRPGYIVFNASCISRRAGVILPDAAMDLRPEGPLRVAQFIEDGVCAVVDLPPFGFAWVPKESNRGLLLQLWEARMRMAIRYEMNRSRSRLTL